MLASLVMVFVGGRFAEDLLGFIGLGSTTARAWNIACWPGALAVAMLVFAFNLVAWLWLSNVALLLGAELNASNSER